MEGPWWCHLLLLAGAPPLKEDDPPRPPLVDRNRLKETADEEEVEVGTRLAFGSHLDFFAGFELKVEEEGLFLLADTPE